MPEYYHRQMKSGSTLGEPEIKTSLAINKMRDSCRLAANILKLCKAIIKVLTRQKN